MLHTLHYDTAKNNHNVFLFSSQCATASLSMSFSFMWKSPSSAGSGPLPFRGPFDATHVNMRHQKPTRDPSRSTLGWLWFLSFNAQRLWRSCSDLSFWCIGWWAILTAGNRWTFWDFNQDGRGWTLEDGNVDEKKKEYKKDKKLTLYSTLPVLNIFV